MDNHNTNQPNSLLKTDPSMFQPAQNPPSKFSNFLSWLRTHKKLVATLAAIFFLLVALGYFGSKTIQNLLNKTTSQNQITEQVQIDTTSSMLITSPKTSYTLAEKIPVGVKASSSESLVTGFDVVIKYDPAFLTLSKRNSPPLTDFLYYGQNTDNLIQVSAVRKPNQNTLQTFNNSELFGFEFTPVKAGKTTLRIVYLPNSTSDSNILDNNSNDVLGSARGLELTIN